MQRGRKTHLVRFVPMKKGRGDLLRVKGSFVQYWLYHLDAWHLVQLAAVSDWPDRQSLELLQSEDHSLRRRLRQCVIPCQRLTLLFSYARYASHRHTQLAWARLQSFQRLSGGWPLASSATSLHLSAVGRCPTVFQSRRRRFLEPNWATVLLRHQD